MLWVVRGNQTWALLVYLMPWYFCVSLMSSVSLGLLYISSGFYGHPA